MHVHELSGGSAVQELCRYYREVCGILAFIVADGGGLIQVRGDDIGAVTTPARLGPAVRGRMDEVPGRCGPISSCAIGGRWMFLAQADLPDIRPRSELDAVNAALVGAAIIPMPGPEGPRKWVVPPTDTYLPSRDQIVHAIRWCRAQPAGVRR